jgi:3-mercaptopropionate dioxygenase
MSDPFSDFIAACRVEIKRVPDAADRVVAIAPLMAELAAMAAPRLGPEHRRGDPAHYARNAIHIDPSGDLSLFALVWLPGQWTPVHDHGSWGVVGIVEGVLEERTLMSAHGDITADEGIVLRRGGMVLLNSGSVSSFVPNPDHIHMTGVSQDRAPCISLHLYGRNMNSFHIYDVAAGSRRLIDVPHHAVR